ncbi:MAG: (2Fe-2S)-binding protein [Alphaproteobacteria bacterium]|nr:(2Fe-2S)-binding protein [Alphaproteobacteria bacterium]MDE2350366.1 (2Fe-2S)-binding protein [Alphaproteobacteria bacterium]
MLELIVNGKIHSFDGDPNTPLLWWLRDEIGLTGTKFGCGEGLCGACTVHLDGTAVRSCQTPVSAAHRRQITTIEGLSRDGDHPVQKAWRELGVPQCGYCQPGQIMQAASLLKENPNPSEAEIVSAMAGNICRCGTYQRILAGIKLAATDGHKSGGPK